MRALTSLSARIFLGYFLVLGLAAYAALGYFTNAIKPAVRQTMEDALVEEANLIAVLAGTSAVPTLNGTGELERAFQELRHRDLNAVIFGVAKKHSDQRVTVTDGRGIVIFDSTGLDEGKDYSQWNDVKRTLRGEYGARSTHPFGPDSYSVMYVAAPITRSGAVVGVVTVSKPITSVDPFLDLARAKLLRTGAVGLLVSLGVGLLFSWLLSRSISGLVRYAERAAEGDKIAPPKLGGELGVLASALESMRTKLDGKKYVEQTVQTFAHEMKSPLSAIVGAAELLEGDLPEPDRLRFATQVGSEARRMQTIVERLLELALVERQQALHDPSWISLKSLVSSVLEGRESALRERTLTSTVAVPEDAKVYGEEFLLQQALGNLVDNAIDFARSGSSLTIEYASESRTLRVHNEGEPIPDFAIPRLFERFYSLPRPETGRRSTGLGLAFVREVSALHGSEISLENEPGGVVAIWRFPAP